MKSYHETGSAKATTQKAERRLQKFQNLIKLLSFDRYTDLLFVMIVHKASQTILSVFFAAIVAIVSARGPQTVRLLKSCNAGFSERQYGWFYL